MSLGSFLQTAGGGALGGAAISAVAGLAGSIGSGRIRSIISTTKSIRSSN